MKYTNDLRSKGHWLDDTECEARLIYINGQFCPALSKTSEHVRNLDSSVFSSSNQELRDDIKKKLERITDGFTDELPTEDDLKIAGGNLISRLSAPDHNVGKATSQFAINNQQGSAIFAALNTCKTGAVALVDIPPNYICIKPVLIVNAQTTSGGVSGQNSNGVAYHPRTLVLAGKKSKVALIQ